MDSTFEHTVENWLKQIQNEHIRNRALSYAKVQGSVREFAESIDDALAKGFRWSSTEEGTEFWADQHYEFVKLPSN